MLVVWCWTTIIYSIDFIRLAKWLFLLFSLFALYVDTLISNARAELFPGGNFIGNSNDNNDQRYRNTESSSNPYQTQQPFSSVNDINNNDKYKYGSPPQATDLLSFGPAAAFRRRLIFNGPAAAADFDHHHHQRQQQPPSQIVLRKTFSWGGDAASNSKPPSATPSPAGDMVMPVAPVAPSQLDSEAARMNEEGGRLGNEWWDPEKHVQYPPPSHDRNDDNHYNYLHEVEPFGQLHSKSVSQYPPEVAALINDVGDGAVSGDVIPHDEMKQAIDGAAALLPKQQQLQQQSQEDGDNVVDTTAAATFLK